MGGFTIWVKLLVTVLNWCQWPNGLLYSRLPRSSKQKRHKPCFRRKKEEVYSRISASRSFNCSSSSGIRSSSTCRKMTSWIWWIRIRSYRTSFRKIKTLHCLSSSGASISYLARSNRNEHAKQTAMYTRSRRTTTFSLRVFSRHRLTESLQTSNKKLLKTKIFHQWRRWS